MSSSDAQRSPVHHATEDSNAEPTGPSGPAASAPGKDAETYGTRSSGSGAAAGAKTSDVNRQEAADLKSRPDNAMGVPGNFEGGAAMAGRRRDADQDATPPGATGMIGGGPGAGDASSGGAAGAGVPGGGTDLRTGGAFNTGDPDQDRQRLFPDANGGQRQRGGDTTKSGDADESSFGGPVNLDDPDAV
jgi:hypothetical protein